MLVSTKTGVQTWSKAAQKSSAKSDNAQMMGAEEWKKNYGDKELGDVLNEIADPSYVNPEKKVRTVGNKELDKDAFMKMMLAQLKNQDPTNPLQSHEMAAQLAQFTSVEQLTNVNETLKSMKASQDPVAGFQALNFIGKSVSGDSSKIYRNANDKSHDLVFDLPMAASEVKIQIKDANGEVVKKFELHNLKSGANKVNWNGTLDNGVATREGEYQFFIEAKGSNNTKLAVKTAFDGTITGVNYTPQGPVLLIGNKTVRLADVRKIVDGSIKNNDQNIKDVTSLDLSNKKTDDKVESRGNSTSPQLKEEKKEQTSVQQQASGSLDNLAMSRGMLDKLEKEMKKAAPATPPSAGQEETGTEVAQAEN